MMGSPSLRARWHTECHPAGVGDGACAAGRSGSIRGAGSHQFAQAGFETDIKPWGDRNFHDNLAPHGWFAARLRIALRNMFIREQCNDLHLLSAISPAWVQPGDEMVVNHAPTNFGTVDLSLRILFPSRAMLTLHDAIVDDPAHIVLHPPWFMETSKVVVDGVSLPVTGSSVVLPVQARTVQIEWRKREHLPELSYKDAVTQHKQECMAHYEQFLKAGN